MRTAARRDPEIVIMPIELGYDEVRGLAKKLRARPGCKISQTDILSDIAAVTGRPMDGMMHALKSERAPKRPAKQNPVAMFNKLPKNAITGLATFEDARACLDEMVANQKRGTKGGMLRICVENAKAVAKASKRKEVDVLNDVAIALCKAAGWLDEDVFAVSFGKREFVVLLIGISAYDNVTHTIRRFENEMGEKRVSGYFPAGVKYIACAKPLDYELEYSMEEAEEFINDVRPDCNPRTFFNWNDPEGAFEW
jgi:hypothetical protein